MLTPHEKLAIRGVQSLTDAELLSLLFSDVSSADELSARLLQSYGGSLAAIAREDVARLRMVEGIGLKRAERLVAAAEWGRRCSVSVAEQQPVIKSSADVANLMSSYFSTIKYEECWVLYLTVSNRLIEKVRVSQGGIVETIVDKRLVVKRALELLSTQIILVHNHPSGVAQPSAEDIDMTQKIKSAAALFDITLLDHIILADDGDYSFRRSKLL